MKKLVISKDLIKNNVDIVKSKTADAAIYAVVKSNAYGHGLCEMARELRECGIDRFALTEPSDALILRQNGFEDEDILIIRSTSSEQDCKIILDASATASIGSTADAVMLNNLAAERGMVCDAHIKIDTGLGRYGFMPSDLNDILSVFRLPNINVTGVFSHFSSARNRKRCALQTALFKEVVSKIRDAGCDPGLLHISASVSLMNGSGELFDAVRVGTAFYGTNPKLQKYGLKPIASFESSIAEIRWLPKGHFVGYSNTYVTKKPVKEAVIPVGYYDGFFFTKKDDVFTLRAKLGRAFRQLFSVLKNQYVYVTVNGKKAKAMGHIGMNHTAVNVTNIECSVDDKVVFNGIVPYFMNSALPREYK